MPDPIHIRMGGYGPPTTGFSRALKRIGDRLAAEFGERIEVKYVWNIMDLGYRAEEGVNPESDTETFIALKCFIDNWRWAGVPFYLRTGKRMAEGKRRVLLVVLACPPAVSGLLTLLLLLRALTLVLFICHMFRPPYLNLTLLRCLFVLALMPV